MRNIAGNYLEGDMTQLSLTYEVQAIKIRNDLKNEDTTVLIH